MSSLSEAKQALEKAGYRVSQQGDALSVTTNSQRPGRPMARPSEVQRELGSLPVVVMPDYGRVKVVADEIVPDTAPSAERIIKEVIWAIKDDNLPDYGKPRRLWVSGTKQIEMEVNWEGSINVNLYSPNLPTIGGEKWQRIAVCYHWHEWLIRVDAEAELSEWLSKMNDETIPFEPMSYSDHRPGDMTPGGEYGLEARG